MTLDFSSQVGMCHVPDHVWITLPCSSENMAIITEAPCKCSFTYVIWESITICTFKVTPAALFKAKFPFNTVLTDRSCEKGHLLRLLPIIVHSQVPDARVHVLYKACIVTGEWHQASLLGWKRRTLKAWQPLRQESTAIQQLHKVKLETRRDRQTTNKH